MDTVASVWQLQGTRPSQPCCKFHGLISQAAQGTENLCSVTTGWVRVRGSSSLLFTVLCRMSMTVILHVSAYLVARPLHFSATTLPSLNSPSRRALKDQKVHKGNRWLKSSPVYFKKCDFLLAEPRFLKAVQNTLRPQFPLIFSEYL